MYYVGLEKLGCEDVTRLFSDEPFSVHGNMVKYDSDEKSTPVMTFGKENITIFYAQVENFSNEVKVDLHNRLSQLNYFGLEDVVKDLVRIINTTQ